MNKKIIVIIITLILTIESNSQKINESLINKKIISVPFLNNNGFYTLVKYGTVPDLLQMEPLSPTVVDTVTELPLQLV